MNKISQQERQIASTHTILLAEDDTRVRLFNVEILVRSGYLVYTSEDGEIAWKALQIKNYNLLITDNDMPNMSGIELVKKLRNAGMTLPVIMVSGAMLAVDLEENSWLQISAVLQKPYAIVELLETVKDVLGLD